jgi:Tol biopolymer transport system component/predicted Ser/Thr protein kinase
MIGKTIAHYHILEKLGEGGMGVVYKARDTHLDRLVALKVLPPDKVADPERKRRFMQEAKAASALKHPNIITIHDIASENSIDFMVMEYVQGKTLDALVPRKGLRLNETLKLSIQMADALAKAHSAGIVHRDLKPTNVMVTDDGLVKVLDFGLAKLTEVSDSGEERTLQSQTDEGTIVGTVSYMSPEQAEGKKVDGRSDIFSFGSVLYEMVTGQKAFHGDSKISTLAAILNQEPKPVSQLVPDIPRDLEKIINRCLRKEASRRWQDMPDLKVTLDELKEESDSGKLIGVPSAVRPGRRTWIWVGAALVFLLGVSMVAIWFGRSTPQLPEVPLTAVPLTSYPGIEDQPTFSPDGTQVAFSWNGEKHDNFDIYVKLVGAGKELRLTTNPADDYSPAWSPDGRLVAFLRALPGGKVAVFLVPALGGSEQKVAETTALFPFSTSALSWSPDSQWLVIADKSSALEPPALFLLSIESGEKRRLTTPPNQSTADFFPAFSPDGRTVAFIRAIGYDGYSGSASNVYLLTVSSDFAPIGPPKQLPFDNPIADFLAWTPDGREIVFSSHSPSGSGLWRVSISGSGKPQRLASLSNSSSSPAISKQGHRLAYAQGFLDPNIWRAEVPDQNGKRNPPTNFISSSLADADPQFSPDGKRIVFTSDRSSISGNQIWVCDGDGSNAKQLTSLGLLSGTPHWSPNGERVAFDSSVGGQWEVYVIDANGGRPQRLTTNPARDDSPTWSRDGKWIYFCSNRTGQDQVWRMLASGGEATQVTRKGGYLALESADGKFLYYSRSSSRTSIWKIPVEGGEESQVVESLSYCGNFDLAEKGIYFIPSSNTSLGFSVQFFSFDIAKVRPILNSDKPTFQGLSLSPDGRWILYSQVDQVGSDLMVVENFR